MRNILSVLLVCLILPHTAELCLTVPLELGKEERGNHDNLAGNRGEAKEAVCERREEHRGTGKGHSWP